MGEAIADRNRHGDALFRYDYGPRLLPGGGAFDLWRYHAVLPRPAGDVRYPLKVGGTPLRAVPELRRRWGLPRLWLKDETAGPSASNKDRATALVLDDGLRRGASVITTSSTGNAAISTAVGAAAAGMAAVIFVPDTCRPEKVRVMAANGAHVFGVRQGYRAAFDLSRTLAARYGWLDRNTGANPLTIEAKKTVAWEIWEQLGRSAPDVVVAPVGDGPTLVGVAKGFRELLACGAIDALPRVIGVQAAGCAPLADAFDGRTGVPADPGATVADGIAVPQPAIAGWTLDEVAWSAGGFITVTDADLAATAEDLRRYAGVSAEPAGAAAAAGARNACPAGLLAASETVVALVTGADTTQPPRPGVPEGSVWTVDDDPAAVTRILAGILPATCLTAVAEEGGQ